PNELASYLLLLLPLLLACTLKAPGVTQRFAYGTLVALGFWLLLLTYTRGALVALLLIVPLLLFLLGGKRLGFSGLLVLVVAVGVLALGAGAARQRLMSVFTSSDSGYTTRLAAWQWATTTFLHHPVLGVGMDNLPLQPDAPLTSVQQGLRQKDAENLALDGLRELGILGLRALVWCI